AAGSERQIATPVPEVFRPTEESTEPTMSEVPEGLIASTDPVGAAPLTSCPADNTWTAGGLDAAPRSKTNGHTAVWTGSEMIVWGGEHSSTTFGDGARYKPSTNLWTPLPTAGAPSPRSLPKTVWTGLGMIVWGGNNHASGPDGSGATYYPSTNVWA